MQQSTRKETTLIQRMALTLLVSAFCAGTAWADGDRVAELERRVAELEAMVETLLDRASDSGTQAAAQARLASADAAEARERVGELDRKIAPVIAAAEKKADMPEFYYGGYIKTDFIFSDFGDGNVAGNSIGRDFFVPSTIPVSGDSEGVQFDVHARQTRFHFGTRHEVGEAKLGSYIEMDFLVTAGGNERVSNSFTPRLRHAYVTYDNWLVGQTWNTFMDVATLPESVDFIGPTGCTLHLERRLGTSANRRHVAATGTRGRRTRGGR